jgi:hypothetical protein
MLIKKLEQAARFITYPVSLHKRDLRLYAHLSDNTTITSDKILRLELGDAVFADMGLKEDDLPHHQIHVKSIISDKAHGPLFRIFFSALAGGYVHDKRRGAYDPKKLNPEQEEKSFHSIFMNRVMFNPATQIGILLLLKDLGKLLVSAPLLFLKSVIINPVFTPLIISTARHVPVLHLFGLLRPFTDIIGHEHIHILQKIDLEEKRPPGSFDGIRGWHALARIPGAITQYLRNYAANAPHEVKADDYNPLENTFRKSARLTGPFRIVRTLDNIMSLGMAPYFRNDFEIQARLHTLLAHGARRWGQLPKTREDLWQALDSMGLPMPAEIRAELKEKLKTDFAAAASPFAAGPDIAGSLRRKANMAFAFDAVELQVAQRSLLRMPLKLEFWQVTLPYLYGHLLELYGQKEGRRMMGFNEAAGVPVIGDAVRAAQPPANDNAPAPMPKQEPPPPRYGLG